MDPLESWTCHSVQCARAEVCDVCVVNCPSFRTISSSKSLSGRAEDDAFAIV